jgi:EamA-like transporter family.
VNFMIQKYAKLFSVTVPLAWGMSYLFMALGASEIPAIELVALRCGLAFLALILIFYRHLKETFSWKMMAYSALAGILLFAVFIFDYWSYCYLSINCWIFSFDNSSHCPHFTSYCDTKNT